MTKKILIGSFFFSGALLLPSFSHAQVPFGGLVVGEYPCTCSPYTWQYFAPLYIDTDVPVTGPLAVADTPFMFSNYYSFPSSWVLGFFVPGVQACWMYIGYGCAPLPSIGVVTPYAGSSL